MPAFCAAVGSFHAKSWVTYFVRVLTTVRVLPLILTFALIRSSTLMVSTFGVRSYSDQRYWSMQASGHASSASELTAGLAASCTGSVGLTAANCIDGVAGAGIARGSGKAVLLPLSATSTEPVASLASLRTGSDALSDAIRADGVAGSGIGRGSDKALPLPVSAMETRSLPSGIAWGASTGSARAIAGVSRPISISPPVFSMLGEPSPARPTPIQAARTAAGHNAANTANRCGLFTLLLLRLVED